ncbi:hypothetical protein [Streptomyces sp. NPDC057939]|uniref:hypothetical protein n=1 Tax=Streptomyces sp. NPDC057939 TaxID=3346284 RepID=UPI0036EF3A96
MGQQVQGEDRLRSVWWPALSDGLRRAGAEGLVAEADVAVGFYGDLFRPAGQFLSVGDPPYSAADVEDGFEQQLLAAWWKGAAETDPEVVSPDADDALVAAPRSVQAALRALSGSKFFADLALRAVVSDLKQVRAYLTDPKTREQARGRVMDRIGPDTRVVVAHSLGSVVAYEALCALPGHQVRALVTIGSPLGIRNLVVDRLQPAPTREGKALRGAWPGGDELAWTNLAGTGDVVALVKDLRPVFGDRLRSAVLSNGTHAHDATAYLTDALCGRAIAEGLA